MAFCTALLHANVLLSSLSYMAIKLREKKDDDGETNFLFNK